MLILGSSLIGKGVLGLRTGAPLAEIVDPIINPNNLKIEGWVVNDRFNKGSSVVVSVDIRDILPQGIVVNDHEALSDPDELVRLQPIIELAFQLLGKPVVTAHHQRLGKVNDFALDKDSGFIQKLYVSQPLIKSFNGGELTIGRTQIVEITNKKIVVKEATVPDKVLSAAPIPAQ